MGPRDHPRPLPDGAACTACGATVPTEAIRRDLAAWDGDLVGWLQAIDAIDAIGVDRRGSVVDR
jgi:hypothetical protein